MPIVLLLQFNESAVFSPQKSEIKQLKTSVHIGYLTRKHKTNNNQQYRSN